MKVFSLLLVVAGIQGLEAVVCNTADTLLNETWRDLLITKHNDRRALLAAGLQVLEDGSYNIPAKEIPPLVNPFFIDLQS